MCLGGLVEVVDKCRRGRGLLRRMLRVTIDRVYGVLMGDAGRTDEEKYIGLERGVPERTENFAKGRSGGNGDGGESKTFVVIFCVV